MKIQSLGSCTGCIVDVDGLRILIDPTVSTASAPSSVPTSAHLSEQYEAQQNRTVFAVSKQDGPRSSSIVPIPVSLLTSLLAEYTGTTLMYAPVLAKVDMATIDVILLSHHTSVLCLPYLTAQDGFHARVFATTPTIEFGKLMMEEIISAQENALTTMSGQPLSRKNLSEIIIDNKPIPTNPSLRPCLTPLELLSVFSAAPTTSIPSFTPITNAANSAASLASPQTLSSTSRPFTRDSVRTYVDELAVALVPLYTRTEALHAIQTIETVSFSGILPLNRPNFRIQCLSSSFCIGGCLWRLETGPRALPATENTVATITEVVRGPTPAAAAHSHDLQRDSGGSGVHGSIRGNGVGSMVDAMSDMDSSNSNVEHCGDSNTNHPSPSRTTPPPPVTATTRALSADGPSIATALRSSLLVVPPLSPLSQRHPTPLQLQGTVDRVFFLDGTVLYRVPTAVTSSITPVTPKTPSEPQLVPISFFSLHDALAEGRIQQQSQENGNIRDGKTGFPSPFMIPAPTHPLGVSSYPKTLPLFVKSVVALLSSSTPFTVIMPLGLYNHTHDLLHQIVSHLTTSAMNTPVLILSRTARALVDSIGTMGEYLTPQILSTLTTVEEHVASRILDSMHAMDHGSLGFGMHKNSGKTRKITYAPTSNILTAKMDDLLSPSTSSSSSSSSTTEASASSAARSGVPTSRQGKLPTTTSSRAPLAPQSTAPVMRKWWAGGHAFTYLSQLFPDSEFATSAEGRAGRTVKGTGNPVLSGANVSLFDPPEPQRPSTGISRVRIFPDVDSCLPLLQEHGTLCVCEEHLIPKLLAALTPPSSSPSSSSSSSFSSSASTSSALAAPPATMRRVLLLDSNATSTASLSLSRPLSCMDIHPCDTMHPHNPSTTSTHAPGVLTASAAGSATHDTLSHVAPAATNPPSHATATGVKTEAISGYDTTDRASIATPSSASMFALVKVDTDTEARMTSGTTTSSTASASALAPTSKTGTAGDTPTPGKTAMTSTIPSSAQTSTLGKDTTAIETLAPVKNESLSVGINPASRSGAQGATSLTNAVSTTRGVPPAVTVAVTPVVTERSHTWHGAGVPVTQLCYTTTTNTSHTTSSSTTSSTSSASSPVPSSATTASAALPSVLCNPWPQQPSPTHTLTGVRVRQAFWRSLCERAMPSAGDVSSRNVSTATDTVTDAATVSAAGCTVCCDCGDSIELCDDATAIAVQRTRAEEGMRRERGEGRETREKGEGREGVRSGEGREKRRESTSGEQGSDVTLDGPAVKRFKGESNSYATSVATLAASASVQTSIHDATSMRTSDIRCRVCSLRNDWQRYTASVDRSVAFLACPLSPSLCVSQVNALLGHVKPQQVIVPQEASSIALAIGKVEVPTKNPKSGKTEDSGISAKNPDPKALAGRYSQLISVLDKLVSSQDINMDGNVTFPSVSRAKVMLQPPPAPAPPPTPTQTQVPTQGQLLSQSQPQPSASSPPLPAREAAIARVAAGLALPCDVTVLPACVRTTADLPWSKWSLPRAFLALQKQCAPLWRSSTVSTIQSVCLTPSIASVLNTTHIYREEDVRGVAFPSTHRFAIIRKNGPEFTFIPNEIIVNTIPIPDIPTPPESSPAALLPARMAPPNTLPPPALSVSTAKVTVANMTDMVVLHPPTPYVIGDGTRIPKLFGEVHIETLAALLLHHFPDLTLSIKGKPISQGAKVPLTPGSVLQFTSISSELGVTVTNGPPVRVRVHGNKKEFRRLALRCLEQATICIAPLSQGGILPVIKDENASCHDIHGCIDV